MEDKHLKEIGPHYLYNSFISTIDIAYKNPEGIFFPDTYFYESGSTVDIILESSAKKMHRVLTKEWQDRPADSILENPYQALILASIIQKEAMRIKEMKRISAVFHNRIKTGMRLQADPTVIYALGKDFKAPLKRSHLKIDNPYNTYMRKGLPPTPICMPGLDAIQAAIRPIKSDEYYFMAKGDGTHQFSNNLSE